MLPQVRTHLRSGAVRLSPAATAAPRRAPVRAVCRVAVIAMTAHPELAALHGGRPSPLPLCGASRRPWLMSPHSQLPGSICLSRAPSCAAARHAVCAAVSTSRAAAAGAHRATLRDRFQLFSRPDEAFTAFHNDIFDGSKSSHADSSAVMPPSRPTAEPGPHDGPHDEYDADRPAAASGTRPRDLSPPSRRGRAEPAQAPPITRIRTPGVTRTNQAARHRPLRGGRMSCMHAPHALPRLSCGPAVSHPGPCMQSWQPRCQPRSAARLLPSPIPAHGSESLPGTPPPPSPPRCTPPPILPTCRTLAVQSPSSTSCPPQASTAKPLRMHTARPPPLLPCRNAYSALPPLPHQSQT